MNFFGYRGGVLHAEDTDLRDLADEVGTPLYCYSSAGLEERYLAFSRVFAAVPSLVCYAMKANSNQAVLATLARLGAGMDVVSEGELRARPRGRRAGREDRVLRRRQDARRDAATRSIRTSCASTSNRSPSSSSFRRSLPRAAARRRISIRVNPDVDAKTHAKISTGTSANKFGIPIERARRASMRGPPSCRARASPASTCISAARSPILRPSMPPTRLLAALARGSAQRGPSTSSMSMSAAGSASLTTPQQRSARPSPSPMPRAILRHCARARPQARLRAWPADRRQRRRARDRSFTSSTGPARPSSSSMRR